MGSCLALPKNGAGIYLRAIKCHAIITIQTGEKELRAVLQVKHSRKVLECQPCI